MTSSNESAAERAGRWYGSQSPAIKVLVVVVGFALAAAILFFVGNTLGDELGGILLIVFAFVVYFFPSFVADRRDVPNKSSVRVINLFLGWTFIGWVVALAMAMAGPGKSGGGQPVASSRAALTPTASDARACPFCAEEIKKAAVVCKHCGRDVPAVG